MNDRVDATEIQHLHWDIPADQDRAHQWVVEYGREDIYQRLKNQVRRDGAYKALQSVIFSKTGQVQIELDCEINLWSCLVARCEREIQAEAGLN